MVGGLVFGVMSLTADSDEWQVEVLDSAPGIALIQVTAPGGGATTQLLPSLTPGPLQALPAEGDPLSSSPSLAAESDQPGEVLLTWEDGQVSEEDPVSRYEVERSGTGNDGDWNPVRTLEADELREHRDWGLQPGELWHYRVRAGFNSSAYSDWSNSVAAAVSGWPPQAPWPSVFSVGSDKVEVEWATHSETPLLGHVSGILNRRWRHIHYNQRFPPCGNLQLYPHCHCWPERSLSRQVLQQFRLRRVGNCRTGGGRVRASLCSCREGCWLQRFGH